MNDLIAWLYVDASLGVVMGIWFIIDVHIIERFRVKEKYRGARDAPGLVYVMGCSILFIGFMKMCLLFLMFSIWTTTNHYKKCDERGFLFPTRYNREQQLLRTLRE